MDISDNQILPSESAARRWKSLWGVVVGFFAFGAVAGGVLRHFGISQPAAYELVFLLSLIILYLIVRRFAEVNIAHVTALIGGSVLYLIQELLSTVMRRSVAVGLSVFLFVAIRDLGLGYSRLGKMDDQAGTQRLSLPGIVIESVLLGALALVATELLLRLWALWQSS